jgi:hypothetical protein
MACSLLLYFYRSLTVDTANHSEQQRTQKGLDKRISNLH